MTKLAPAIAVLALVLAASAVEAREVWSRGEASLRLSGSVRDRLVVGGQTDADAFEDRLADPRCVRAADFDECPAFGVLGEDTVWQNLTRLRTRADGRLGEALEAVVVYDLELLAGELDTLESALASGLARDSFLGAEGNIGSEDDPRVRARHSLYRGYLQGEFGPVRAVVGRQRIAWGVGRLWNPIDRFNAIPPLAIEADESPGVDAVLLQWNFDGFTAAQVVYAAADRAVDARYALRLEGVTFDTDWSLMGGVFEQAPAVGLDLARNWGEAAVRLEAVWTNPKREVWRVGDLSPHEPGAFFQVVTSIDYQVDWGPGIYLLLEHFYNGNAEGFGSGRAGAALNRFEATGTPPDPALPAAAGPFVKASDTDRFAGSRVGGGARHQTGLQVGTDVTPELRGDLLGILDWNGPSTALTATFRYTPADWVELTLGGQWFIGSQKSEYGLARDLGFVLVDLFF